MATDSKGNISIEPQDSPPGGLGGLIYGTPNYTPANLDQGTSNLVDQKVKQSNLTDQQVADQQLAGTGNNLNIPDQNQFSNALGGYQDPAIHDALKARAERYYGSDLNHLQRQVQARAPGTRGEYMDQAFKAAMGQQQAAWQNNVAQLHVAHNRQIARAKVINDLFTGGGALGGHAMAKGNASGAANSGVDPSLAEDGSEIGSSAGAGSAASMGSMAI